MTPGPEDEVTQSEKRNIMRQDADVRRRQQEQSRNGDTGTYLSHTHDDTSGGRYAAIGSAMVVGAKADVASVYPAAAPHQRDPVGQEPSLGYPIDEPSAVISLHSPVEATGGAEAPSSSASDVEHAAPPSSSEGRNNG